MNEKLNKYFDKNNNDDLLTKQKLKKNNLYIDTLLFTNNNKKDKKSIYLNSYSKYKRTNSNDFFFKNFTEKNLDKNKKKVVIRNTFIRRSKSKPILNNFNAYNNNDITNTLLNHYPNIEKHRKKKFRQEIKDIIKNITKELNNQNNKLIYGYYKRNQMTPYKIINQKYYNGYSVPYLNDEDIYKYNIMAKSKILNIDDIQPKNVRNFFNTEKFEYYKRSSSLENLKIVINKKMPKYISDFYYNKNIKKHGIKIYNYKSNKLREIYDELN
jgi:hypothetical protein